jgi:hypothetical protein
VQEHTLQPQAACDPVGLGIAVIVIAGDRVAQRLPVHADLVGPAGTDVDLHQGEARKLLQRGKTADGAASDIVRGVRRPHLPPAGLVALKRDGQVATLRGTLPPAGHQGQVTLADRAAAQGLVKGAQPAAALGQHQAAAGFAIQPVPQFQGRAGAQQAHGLDDPVGQAAATVHGQPRGLVEHQVVVVLVDDRLAQGTQHALGNVKRPRRVSRIAGTVQCRDLDLVALGHPALDPRPAAIDADRPLAHQPVDQAARDALQMPQQEIVQPLPFRRRGHLQHLRSLILFHRRMLAHSRGLENRDARSLAVANGPPAMVPRRGCTSPANPMLGAPRHQSALAAGTSIRTGAAPPILPRPEIFRLPVSSFCPTLSPGMSRSSFAILPMNYPAGMAAMAGRLSPKATRDTYPDNPVLSSPGARLQAPSGAVPGRCLAVGCPPACTRRQRLPLAGIRAPERPARAAVPGRRRHPYEFNE